MMNIISSNLPKSSLLFCQNHKNLCLRKLSNATVTKKAGRPRYNIGILFYDSGLHMTLTTSRVGSPSPVLGYLYSRPSPRPDRFRRRPGGVSKARTRTRTRVRGRQSPAETCSNWFCRLLASAILLAPIKNSEKSHLLRGCWQFHFFNVKFLSVEIEWIKVWLPKNCFGINSFEYATSEIIKIIENKEIEKTS